MFTVQSPLPSATEALERSKDLLLLLLLFFTGLWLSSFKRTGSNQLGCVLSILLFSNSKSVTVIYFSSRLGEKDGSCGSVETKRLLGVRTIIYLGRRLKNEFSQTISSQYVRK